MEARDFRAACGRFATGVTVVARVRDGMRLGVTVSSFTSVSLAPPLVLVCVHARSSFLAGLAAGDAVTVNILAAEQREIAERFAKLPPPERFTAAHWEGTRLRGAAALLECSVREVRAVGDHAVVLAEAMRMEAGDAEPLVYWQSDFRELAAPDGPDSLALAA